MADGRRDVAPSRGRGSKPFHNVPRRRGSWVAPSRGRGSKRGQSRGLFLARRSPPHGGVDRNSPDRGEDGQGVMVAPSRGRGSKLTALVVERQAEGVAPSRGRGSKLRWRLPKPRAASVAPSRGRGSKRPCRCRQRRDGWVAPSRGRGSKPRSGRAMHARPPRSPPHGGVDRNRHRLRTTAGLRVAPSRGRGSKRHPFADEVLDVGRALHRRVGLLCLPGRRMSPDAVGPGWVTWGRVALTGVGWCRRRSGDRRRGATHGSLADGRAGREGVRLREISLQSLAACVPTPRATRGQSDGEWGGRAKVCSESGA